MKARRLWKPPPGVATWRQNRQGWRPTSAGTRAGQAPATVGQRRAESQIPEPVTSSQAARPRPQGEGRAGERPSSEQPSPLRGWGAGWVRPTHGAARHGPPPGTARRRGRGKPPGCRSGPPQGRTPGVRVPQKQTGKSSFKVVLPLWTGSALPGQTSRSARTALWWETTSNKASSHPRFSRAMSRIQEIQQKEWKLEDNGRTSSKQ